MLFESVRQQEGIGFFKKKERKTELLIVHPAIHLTTSETFSYIY